MCPDHLSEPEKGKSGAEQGPPVPPFVVWPLAQPAANVAWQLLYQLAWQQALAASPRRAHPDLFAVWN